MWLFKFLFKLIKIKWYENSVLQSHQPHFKCSVATCGQKLWNWAAKLHRAFPTPVLLYGSIVQRWSRLIVWAAKMAFLRTCDSHCPPGSESGRSEVHPCGLPFMAWGRQVWLRVVGCVQQRQLRAVTHFSLYIEADFTENPGLSAAAGLSFEWGIRETILSLSNLLPIDHCFSHAAVSVFFCFLFFPEFCWKNSVLQSSPLLSTWGYSFLKAVKDSPLIWCHIFYLSHTLLNISQHGNIPQFPAPPLIYSCSYISSVKMNSISHLEPIVAAWFLMPFVSTE